MRSLMQGWKDWDFSTLQEEDDHAYPSVGAKRSAKSYTVISRILDISFRCNFTCIIDYPPLCPMLDDHSKRPNSRVNLDIRLDHPCVLQSQGIIDVHVTMQS